MSKIIIVSFAAGDKWYRSQHFLNESAKQYGVDGCVSFTDKNLNKEFVAKYERLLKPEVRGFGFWMWKPFIIAETLKMVNEDDVVIYVDSGNAVMNSLKPLAALVEYTNPIALFENKDGNPTGQVWKNNEWTKGDCFRMMACDYSLYHTGNQVDAAYQVYRKCKFTTQFVGEYLKYAQDENVISDLPNIKGFNCPEFKDHRHDQSILSLLAIKYGLITYPEPSEWGNRPEDRQLYSQLFWHHRGIF